MEGRQSPESSQAKHYEKGELDAMLRSNLSGIIYGWAGMFPQPMTDFKEICLMLNKNQVDSLVSYIKKGLVDSTNLDNVNAALTEAVNDFKKGKFDYQAFEKKISFVASQPRNVSYIETTKEIQTGIKEALAASINLDTIDETVTKLKKDIEDSKKNLEKLQKKNKDPNETFTGEKQDIIKQENLLAKISKLPQLKKAHPELYQLLEEHVRKLTVLGKENNAVGSTFAGKIDQIFRDSRNYDDPDVANTIKRLKSKLDEAWRDVPMLVKIQSKINDAVLEAKKRGNDTKQFTIFNTKYPSHTPTDILLSLEEKRQEYGLPVDPQELSSLREQRKKEIPEEQAEKLSSKLAFFAKSSDPATISKLVAFIKDMPGDNAEALDSWKSGANVPPELQDIVGDIVNFKKSVLESNDPFGLPPVVDNLNDRLDDIKVINHPVLLTKFLTNTIPTKFVIESSKKEGIERLIWWDGYLSRNNNQTDEGLIAVMQVRNLSENSSLPEDKERLQLLEEFKMISAISQIKMDKEKGIYKTPTTPEEMRAFLDLRNQFRKVYIPDGTHPTSPLIEEYNNVLNTINNDIKNAPKAVKPEVKKAPVQAPVQTPKEDKVKHKEHKPKHDGRATSNIFKTLTKKAGKTVGGFLRRSVELPEVNPDDVSISQDTVSNTTKIPETKESDPKKGGSLRGSHEAVDKKGEETTSKIEEAKVEDKKQQSEVGEKKQQQQSEVGEKKQQQQSEEKKPAWVDYRPYKR